MSQLVGHTPPPPHRPLTHRDLLLLFAGLWGGTLLDLFDLCQHLLVLGRVKPVVLPVAVTNAGREAGSYGIEHELGRVDVGRAERAVTGEVVAEDVAVGADVTEVDGFAATLEQEELVEGLNEQRGRLVDGTEDGLAVVCELAQEADEVPCALTIKTGCRLVEEE